MLKQVSSDALMAAHVSQAKYQATDSSLNTVRDELEKTKQQLQSMQTEMVAATALQPPGTPVSQQREILFRSIATAKLAQSGDGSIKAHGKKGRSVTFVRMPLAEKLAIM